MAEVLASLKKIGGNGEKYTETVLWTNPSPTADFAAQTITLSDSISNYKYIGIKYCFNKTNTSIIDTAIYKTEEMRASTTDSGTDHNAIMLGLQTSNYYSFSRVVGYVSDTSIKFTTGYRLNAASSSANANIPLEILGINELAHKTTIAMDLIGEVSLPANSATVTCTTTQNISDYKNLFITMAEYNGSELVISNVASPPLQFVDTEYFASNSVTGYYAAGSTLTSYPVTMQKLSDTSIQFTRTTASGTRQVYVYGIK